MVCAQGLFQLEIAPGAGRERARAARTCTESKAGRCHTASEVARANMQRDGRWASQVRAFRQE